MSDGLEIKFDIDDLKKLQQQNENVVKFVTTDGDGSLIAKVALAVERRAKINASGRPGPKVRTGRLRASILPTLISYLEAEVGTNVEYAPFVEFGHFIPVGVGSRGGLMKNTSHLNPMSLGQRQTPAYPFLYPAVDQVKSNGDLDGVFVSYSNDIGDNWS